MQHMGLCVFSLHIALMTILRICVLYLIIILNRKYDLLPLFKVRSWNNGMRCTSFYILARYIPQSNSKVWKRIIKPMSKIKMFSFFDLPCLTRGTTYLGDFWQYYSMTCASCGTQISVLLLKNLMICANATDAFKHETSVVVINKSERE